MPHPLSTLSLVPDPRLLFKPVALLFEVLVAIRYLFFLQPVAARPMFFKLFQHAVLQVALLLWFAVLPVATRTEGIRRHGLAACRPRAQAVFRVPLLLCLMRPFAAVANHICMTYFLLLQMPFALHGP